MVMGVVLPAQTRSGRAATAGADEPPAEGLGVLGAEHPAKVSASDRRPRCNGLECLHRVTPGRADAGLGAGGLTLTEKKVIGKVLSGYGLVSFAGLVAASGVTVRERPTLTRDRRRSWNDDRF